MGSTPYHICYKVNDMDDTVEELQEMGFILLEREKSSIPLVEMYVSYILQKSGCWS